jgi:hypothetical protein
MLKRTSRGLCSQSEFEDQVVEALRGLATPRLPQNGIGTISLFAFAMGDGNHSRHSESYLGKGEPRLAWITFTLRWLRSKRPR